MHLESCEPSAHRQTSGKQYECPGSNEPGLTLLGVLRNRFRLRDLPCREALKPSSDLASWIGFIYASSNLHVTETVVYETTLGYAFIP